MKKSANGGSVKALQMSQVEIFNDRVSEYSESEIEDDVRKDRKNKDSRGAYDKWHKNDS